jgi:hypothetical protein
MGEYLTCVTNDIRIPYTETQFKIPHFLQVEQQGVTQGFELLLSSFSRT